MSTVTSLRSANSAELASAELASTKAQEALAELIRHPNHKQATLAARSPELRPLMARITGALRELRELTPDCTDQTQNAVIEAWLSAARAQSELIDILERTQTRIIQTRAQTTLHALGLLGGDPDAQNERRRSCRALAASVLDLSLKTDLGHAARHLRLSDWYLPPRLRNEDFNMSVMDGREVLTLSLRGTMARAQRLIALHLLWRLGPQARALGSGDPEASQSPDKPTSAPLSAADLTGERQRSDQVLKWLEQRARAGDLPAWNRQLQALHQAQARGEAGLHDLRLTLLRLASLRQGGEFFPSGNFEQEVDWRGARRHLQGLDAGAKPWTAEARTQALALCDLMLGRPWATGALGPRRTPDEYGGHVNAPSPVGRGAYEAAWRPGWPRMGLELGRGQEESTNAATQGRTDHERCRP